MRFVIGDGTNRRAYYVGGSDDQGFPVSGGWSVYRLDTDNLPASYSQEAGSGAPTLSSITSVGMGVLSSSKAIGNVVNTFIDRICYIANGSAAFKVNGGTSGTPETFADLVSDDITNGWGFFNNPISGSKQYGIYGAVEWGDATASTASYFNDSDAQIYFIGTGQSAGSMDQDMLANSGATNSFVLNNCVLINVGAVCNWNFNVTNHDILQITNCQFVDHGTIAMPTTSVNKYFRNDIFDGCGIITVSTVEYKDCVTRNAAVGILLSSTSHNISGGSITGCVIGLRVNTRGSYTLSGVLFSSNTTDVENTCTPTTTDSYAESNQDTNQPVGNGTISQAGQSFSGDGNVLSQVRLYLKKVGSPTGNATIKIYASTGTDPNRTPTGAILITSINFDVSTLTASYALYKFNLDLEQTLSSGTGNYFVVLDCSALTLGDASNYVHWGTDASSPGHTNNNFATYSGSWSAVSGQDGCFYLYTGGLVIVNKTVGSNPITTNNSTAPNGVYTALKASYNLTITGLTAGSEVRAYVGTIGSEESSVEIGGIESSGTSFAFSHNSGGQSGYIVIINTALQPFTLSLTYSSSDQTIPVSLFIDLNYKNPNP